MAVELLDPVVADVANVDIAAGVESQAHRIAELPVAGTERSELAQIVSVGVEFLDPVVAAVGDVDAARVDGNILRINELSITGAGRADSCQIDTAAGELHNVVSGERID